MYNQSLRSGNSIVEKIAFYPPNPKTLISHHYIDDKLHIQHPEGHTISIIYKSVKHTNNDEIPTIIYSHGNSEDLGCICSYIDYLYHTLNCNIIAYEYLGYGHCYINTNSAHSQYPSEQGCYESIELAYNFAKNKNPNSPIILMGFSIGSGPTVDLASRKKVSGVILIAPFKSAIKSRVDNIFYNLLPVSDIFENDQKISNIKAPILLIHGTADNVINIQHSYELFSKMNRFNYYEPLWIFGASHNNILSYKYYDIVTPKIKEFVDYINKILVFL